MRWLGLHAVAAILFAATIGCAAAQDIKTLTRKGTYDDVKFELSNAIIERGLTVDHTGDIGAMLERTGKDVGSTRPVYAHAQFLSFCSAKLSREMMEADASNLAFCPYVIFIYETAAAPGEIVVGYRPPMLRGNAASRAALAEIDTLLDGIVKDAVK